MSKNYIIVSGLVFGLIALGQATRAFLSVPVHVGSFEVPVLASWFAAAVAGGLCVWAFPCFLDIRSGGEVGERG